MDNKQIFAKVGVVVLLGVNFAAYYFIWPHKQGSARNEARVSAQEKSETQLVPAKKDDKPPPREIPASVWTEAKPVETPKPPAKPAEKASDHDALYKLLEHIKKETDLPKSPADGKKPNSLPPLPDNLLPNDRKPGVAPASASTPKTGPSPWLVNMETIGEQTQLITRLRQRSSVEFKILCDRVEMKASSGAVQALGKVTFSGAGIKGACQRLVIPLHETQLVFETEAHIFHDLNPGSSLRGERIAWEPSTAPAEAQPFVAPAEFRVPQSVAPLPSGSGFPK